MSQHDSQPKVHCSQGHKSVSKEEGGEVGCSLSTCLRSPQDDFLFPEKSPDTRARGCPQGKPGPIPASH